MELKKCCNHAHLTRIEDEKEQDRLQVSIEHESCILVLGFICCWWLSLCHATTAQKILTYRTPKWCIVYILSFFLFVLSFHWTNVFNSSSEMHRNIKKFFTFQLAFWPPSWIKLQLASFKMLKFLIFRCLIVIILQFVTEWVLNFPNQVKSQNWLLSPSLSYCNF